MHLGCTERHRCSHTHTSIELACICGTTSAYNYGTTSPYIYITMARPVRITMAAPPENRVVRLLPVDALDFGQRCLSWLETIA